MTSPPKPRTAIKPHAEGDPDFVYVTYINVPPEKVWAALTDKAERPYWGHTRHDSTFEPGSALRFVRNGKVDVEGEILEVDAPRRLAYTFHVAGPGPQHDEGPTLVEYLIEPNGPATKLTVIHSNLKRDSKVRAGISQGWPAILSRLKSELETGHMPLFGSMWGAGQ
jgi:uncharacterized protein YndB with AHSA1/START domain